MTGARSRAGEDRVSPEDAASDLTLRGYLAVLRRRAWLVVTVAATCAGVVLGAAAVRDEVYEADAQLVLRESLTDRVFNATSGRAVFHPDRIALTEVALLESDRVEQEVARALDRTPPEVEATLAEDADVVTATVRSEDPQLAARAANAYAEAFIEVRRSEDEAAALDAVEELQAEIDALQERIDALALDPSRASERASLVSQQSAFRSELDELRVQAAIGSGGAAILNAAVEPTDPVSPKPARDTVIALLLGLVLGVALAFVVDHFDDSVRTVDDLERAVPGVPIIGAVPHVGAWRVSADSPVVALDDPGARATEAFRAVRTALDFLATEHGHRVFMITSAAAGEGKSAVAANLGVLFARAGLRTAVVDADLRRPRLHRFFDVPHAPGFTSVVLGDEPVSAAYVPIEGVEGLVVLPVGPRQPLPSEVLASPRSGEVLRRLAAEFDVVLVDAAPTVPVTDAVVLTRWVDAVVLVVRAHQADRRNVQRAVALLEQAQVPIAGVILNDQRGSEFESVDGYGSSPSAWEAPIGSERRRPRTAPDPVDA